MSEPSEPAPEAAWQDAARLFQHALRLQAAGELDGAEKAWRRAMVIEPRSASAACNLANLYAAVGRVDEAESLYRQALERDPTHVNSHVGLAVLCVAQRRLAEALQLALSAAALLREGAPATAPSWASVGGLLLAGGELAQAERILREAVRLEPGSAQAANNLCLTLLAQGRYAEAWPLHDARHAVATEPVRAPPTLAPRWRGEPLAGRSLLVWPEQGHGDMVMCARYARVARTLGAGRVVFACSDALRGLLGRAEGVDAAVTPADPLPAHDRWCFAMDLPACCGTTASSIPSATPSLRADPRRVAAWREKLPAGRKVGLVWRGSAAHRNDGVRSLDSLAAFAALWAAAPRVTFVSLQKGEPTTGTPVLDAGSAIRDFDDTAALVASMDLVVTVDTAAAHIAGALGRPAWVLLPRWGCDWRWSPQGSGSPWYPGTLRLYRQDAFGEWTGAIARVAQDLAGWAAS